LPAPALISPFFEGRDAECSKARSSSERLPARLPPSHLCRVLPAGRDFLQLTHLSLLAGSATRETAPAYIVAKRSAPQGAVLVVIQKLSPAADARRRLSRKGEVELFEQQSVISLRISVAA
jgi:hypothetical protein